MTKYSCLLLRQDRCFLLRQDGRLLLRHLSCLNRSPGSELVLLQGDALKRNASYLEFLASPCLMFLQRKQLFRDMHHDLSAIGFKSMMVVFGKSGQFRCWRTLGKIGLATQHVYNILNMFRKRVNHMVKVVTSFENTFQTAL